MCHAHLFFVSQRPPTLMSRVFWEVHFGHGLSRIMCLDIECNISPLLFFLFSNRPRSLMSRVFSEVHFWHGLSILMCSDIECTTCPLYFGYDAFLDTLLLLLLSGYGRLEMKVRINFVANVHDMSYSGKILVTIIIPYVDTWADWSRLYNIQHSTLSLQFHSFSFLWWNENKVLQSWSFPKNQTLKHAHFMPLARMYINPSALLCTFPVLLVPQGLFVATTLVDSHL